MRTVLVETPFEHPEYTQECLKGVIGQGAMPFPVQFGPEPNDEWYKWVDEMAVYVDHGITPDMMAHIRRAKGFDLPVSFHMLESLRGTGRTKRMLDEAVNAFCNGEQVLVVTHNRDWSTRLYDLAMATLEPMIVGNRSRAEIWVKPNRSIKPSGHIEFDAIGFSRDSLRGKRFDRVLIDHFCWRYSPFETYDLAEKAEERGFKVANTEQPKHVGLDPRAVYFPQGFPIFVPH